MNKNAARFAHQRLDACRVALELFQGVEIVAAAFPRGFADLKDQLRRSVTSPRARIGSLRGAD